MKTFAVLQLSSCAGCEVALLNADEWIDRYRLAYMPLVTSAHELPEVDLLLVSGSVHTDEDLHSLRKAVRKANQVVAVGTCAISGGVAHLGDRDEVRQLFHDQAERRHVPRLLPRSRPVDAVVTVDLYLPGCPPTPELFMAALGELPDFKPGSSVCQECGRHKDRDIRPAHLSGFQKGEVLPDLCLVNQGYMCIGTSTRGGCMALCTRPGHPCVGCRGPSNAFIEKESSAWLTSIKKVFTTMTDIPEKEIETALQSPQYAMFLFQFSDYDELQRAPRPREKVL
jgi:coenzyme F420-reducing hydrogenase gamma subunit